MARLQRSKKPHLKERLTRPRKL